MSEVVIKDLGELAGEVLAFGGPYSNLQATSALLAEAERRGIAPGSRICTGDAVAYCAKPKEVIAALDEDTEWLAGNCEKQLGIGAPDCGCGFDDGSACDLLSKAWYPVAQRALSDLDRDRLNACPDLIVFCHAGLRYAVIHGGQTDISRFIWPTSSDAVFAEEMAAIFKAVGKFDAVIAGHCGIAFERDIAGVRWINAGVIGMPPHDGRPQSRYVVIGADGARIERLRYDHEGAQAAMLSAGLRQGYEKTLLSGIWPSEDVLPRAMRR